MTPEAREELGYRFEMKLVGNKTAVRATITCLRNGRQESRLFRSKLYSNQSQAEQWFAQWLDRVAEFRAAITKDRQ